MRGDDRIKTVAIDGYMALNAYVPRRSAVPGADRPAIRAAGRIRPLAEALAGAHRKWPTGIYLLWYPIKDFRAARALAATLPAWHRPHAAR